MARIDAIGVFWTDMPKLPPKKGDGSIASNGASRAAVVRRGPPPESDWTPPEHFPELDGVWSVDVETRDPHIMKMGPGWAFRDRAEYGEVVGIAASWDEGRGAGYWPIGHAVGLPYDGHNVDPEPVWRWLRAQMRKPASTVVMHNALYDWGWIEHGHGIDVFAKVEDTMTYACLLDEHRRSYKLDALSKTYLDEGKDETLLRRAAEHYGVDPKSGLWRLPSEYVGPYATADARQTLRLRHVLAPKIVESRLTDIFRLETDLLPVLLEMRRVGVPIDTDRASQLDAAWQTIENEHLDKLRQLCGRGVDVWSNDALEAIYTAAKIEFPRTANGTASFTKGWLAQRDDAVSASIMEVRRRSKARGTFLQNAILGHTVDGRIHGNFNPLRSDDTGTISGRFSSTSPNLQQVPARDEEIGPDVRSCFVPEAGHEWAALDFSQQEPRLTVHYAVKIAARGAMSAAEEYRTNPRTDFHDYVSSITGQPRKKAKGINLGLIYGMQELTLCRHVGLPTEFVNVRGEQREIPGPEARELFRTYHDRLPFVSILSEECQARGKKYGHLRTIGGRLVRFPRGQKLHAALNRLIQSSAADWTKRAMVDLYRDVGVVPHVTVHDELGFSVLPDDNYRTARRYAEVMANCMACEVPMLVDIEVGRSWGHATEKVIG